MSIKARIICIVAGGIIAGIFYPPFLFLGILLLLVVLCINYAQNRAAEIRRREEEQNHEHEIIP